MLLIYACPVRFIIIYKMYFLNIKLIIYIYILFILKSIIFIIYYNPINGPLLKTA